MARDTRSIRASHEIPTSPGEQEDAVLTLETAGERGQTMDRYTAFALASYSSSSLSLFLPGHRTKLQTVLLPTRPDLSFSFQSCDNASVYISIARAQVYVRDLYDITQKNPTPE